MPPIKQATTPAPRLRLTLRVVASVDFRRGVPYHYDELRAKRLFRDLTGDETLLLVSKTNRHLAFVFNEVGLTSETGQPVRAVSFYRVQLDHHTPWNPLMLAEYARQAGIELAQVQRFSEHLERIAREAKKAA